MMSCVGEERAALRPSLIQRAFYKKSYRRRRRWMVSQAVARREALGGRVKEEDGDGTDDRETIKT